MPLTSGDRPRYRTLPPTGYLRSLQSVPEAQDRTHNGGPGPRLNRIWNARSCPTEHLAEVISSFACVCRIVEGDVITRFIETSMHSLDEDFAKMASLQNGSILAFIRDLHRHLPTVRADRSDKGVTEVISRAVAEIRRKSCEVPYKLQAAQWIGMSIAAGYTVKGVRCVTIAELEDRLAELVEHRDTLTREKEELEAEITGARLEWEGEKEVLVAARNAAWREGYAEAENIIMREMAENDAIMHGSELLAATSVPLADRLLEENRAPVASRIPLEDRISDPRDERTRKRPRRGTLREEAVRRL